MIHFNWGLHDLKHIAPDSNPRHNGKRVAVGEGEIMVPLEAYEANLERLVKRLKDTGASLIWCSTTPVPQGAAGRIPADALRYNVAAQRVMQPTRHP